MNGLCWVHAKLIIMPRTAAVVATGATEGHHRTVYMYEI